jgi:GNAT superfamily N-acetyltransferase
VADASVRTAAPGDAAAVARVQAVAWRTAYADLLPPDVLDRLDEPATVDEWQEAISAPPVPAYRVLVATDGPDVVGYAAFGPAMDTDLDDSVDAEITGLSVRPESRGRGHGSRLVNASVHHLREDAFLRAYVWLAAPGGPDDDLHHLLTGAGWGPDGATRELDLRGDGALVVAQVRLQTVIGGKS